MKPPRSAPVLLLLLQCVSSLPVTHTHLEHEDVTVIKCIVEVLADALSKPPSLPVSQQCLETLRSDDRLVTVLRRRNFLQELQDIAVEGANERTEKEIEEGPDRAPDLQEPADRSMLMAVRTPGEMLEERGAEQEKEHQSQENDIINSQEEEEKEEHAVMKKTENSEEEEEEEEEEEDETEAVGAPEQLQNSRVEEESQKQEERHQEAVEKHRAGMGGQRNWSRSKETVHRRAYGQQEVPPHHSKEAWKSPEEEELQLMAGREPEERRDLEEGSGTKKTEDAEMESLAVMENELENMAQKLHKLRHG